MADDTNPAPVTGERHAMVSLAASVDAVDTLLETSRHRVDLLSAGLDPNLYNRVQSADALRRLVVNAGKRARIRILVSDAGNLARQGHRLLELSRQLTSFVEIRQLAEDDAQQNQAILIGDGRHYCHWPDGMAYNGAACLHGRGVARRLERVFNGLWERAAVDPELRRLHL